jgi:hypothetical protein
LLRYFIQQLIIKSFQSSVDKEVKAEEIDDDDYFHFTEDDLALKLPWYLITETDLIPSFWKWIMNLFTVYTIIVAPFM